VADYQTQVMLQHIAMGMFYSGVSPKAKEFLRDKQCTTLKEMKVLLLKYETDIGNSTGQQIHEVSEIDAMRHQRRDDTSRPQRRDRTAPVKTDYKKKLQCYYCSKMGHGQKECRKRARDKAPMVKNPNRVNELDEGQVQEQFEQFNSLNWS